MTAPRPGPSTGAAWSRWADPPSSSSSGSLEIVRGLRPLQQVTIQLGGQQRVAEPAIPNDIVQILASLGH